MQFINVATEKKNTCEQLEEMRCSSLEKFRKRKKNYSRSYCSMTCKAVKSFSFSLETRDKKRKKERERQQYVEMTNLLRNFFLRFIVDDDGQSSYYSYIRNYSGVDNDWYLNLFLTFLTKCGTLIWKEKLWVNLIILKTALQKKRKQSVTHWVACRWQFHRILLCRFFYICRCHEEI